MNSLAFAGHLPGSLDGSHRPRSCSGCFEVALRGKCSSLLVFDGVEQALFVSFTLRSSTTVDYVDCSGDY